MSSNKCVANKARLDNRWGCSVGHASPNFNPPSRLDAHPRPGGRNSLDVRPNLTMTRAELADFIRRFADGRSEDHEWKHYITQHYKDIETELARVRLMHRQFSDRH